ncbi:hypothetical protein GH714_040386 [Hevea brasiliensis]|uniref:Uncharacterized protein n=1 Tax=Hevea brasiliensis TaxID=3981 RepID=A0A6A6MPY7_HEVBR|nr:hypothetical protein GH714_040386 [Hevea brasiliensis]
MEKAPASKPFVQQNIFELRVLTGPSNAKAAGPSGVKISEVEEEEEEHVEAAEKLPPSILTGDDVAPSSLPDPIPNTPSPPFTSPCTQKDTHISCRTGADPGCEQRNKPYVGKNAPHCMHVYGSVQGAASTRKLRVRIHMRHPCGTSRCGTQGRRLQHMAPSGGPDESPSLLGERRTLRPVVATGPRAPLDLVGVHAEFIGAVDGVVDVIVLRRRVYL